MPLRFTCPHCRAHLTAPDTAAGTAGPCPHCQATVRAPLPDASGQEAVSLSADPPPAVPPATSACPHCGHAIRAEAIFCKHCRQPIATASPSPDASCDVPAAGGMRSQRKPWVIALVVLGALVALALMVSDYRQATGDGTDPDAGADATTPATTTDVPMPLDDAEAPPPVSTESLEAFHQAAQDVPYRDLLRYHERYQGTKLVVLGTIGDVEESGRTQHFILYLKTYDVDLDPDYGYTSIPTKEDPIAVRFTRPADAERVLEGDSVRVWGVMRGMVDLEDGYGATIRAPAIDAAFVRPYHFFDSPPVAKPGVGEIE